MRRLIGFILIFALFLAFIVLNLDNKCDVSFGFQTAKDLPVFITAFVAFFFGMLCAVPFIIGLKKSRPRVEEPIKPHKGARFFGRKGKSHAAVEGENDPYGID
ncbi:hypothetical protein [Leadbettera azotonutricia]|uniref:Lipopolysaccharide assembly protein A domain-containing protein n=1 Tax=Leadbettera azotonutricia (strain ATCC BAA-888 / DSM 13862 / ZAS-9) TaxID=545695 RepID=F5Y8I7_LEAAZ|nr:hypothetical protein [Leadbettera azotonutricia]AEF80450.1 conserved hypothetical protein [Leadbettera azotonutricia ZAS-9]